MTLVTIEHAELLVVILSRLVRLQVQQELVGIQRVAKMICIYSCFVCVDHYICICVLSLWASRASPK